MLQYIQLTFTRLDLNHPNPPPMNPASEIDNPESTTPVLSAAFLWRNGRALILLMLLEDLGRPAQLQEMVAITGGDDETIRKYCSLLRDLGLLARLHPHSGWSITPAGRIALHSPCVETQNFASRSVAFLPVLPPPFNPQSTCTTEKLSTAPVDNFPKKPDIQSAKPFSKPENRRKHVNHPPKKARKPVKSPQNPLKKAESRPLINTTITSTDSSSSRKVIIIGSKTGFKTGISALLSKICALESENLRSEPTITSLLRRVRQKAIAAWLEAISIPHVVPHCFFAKQPPPIRLALPLLLAPEFRSLSP
jgi:hypothetical protein